MSGNGEDALICMFRLHLFIMISHGASEMFAHQKAIFHFLRHALALFLMLFFTMSLNAGIIWQCSVSLSQAGKQVRMVRQPGDLLGPDKKHLPLAQSSFLQERLANNGTQLLLLRLSSLAHESPEDVTLYVIRAITGLASEQNPPRNQSFEQ